MANELNHHVGIANLSPTLSRFPWLNVALPLALPFEVFLESRVA